MGMGMEMGMMNGIGSLPVSMGRGRCFNLLVVFVVVVVVVVVVVLNGQR